MFTPNLTDRELAELLVALVAGEPLSREERRGLALELLRMRRALSELSARRARTR